MHATPKTRVTAALVTAMLATGAIAATATMASASAGPHPNPHPSPHSSTSPAKPAKPEPTMLSISNKVIAHARHHADAITGVLTSADAGVAGETITLEARSGKMPDWQAVATAVTGANGAVTFTVAPKVKTQYKLVFAGDAKFRESASNVITLKIIK